VRERNIQKKLRTAERRRNEESQGERLLFSKENPEAHCEIFVYSAMTTL
jgi:hypothetical protein